MQRSQGDTFVVVRFTCTNNSSQPLYVYGFLPGAEGGNVSVFYVHILGHMSTLKFQGRIRVYFVMGRVQEDKKEYCVHEKRSQQITMID